MKVILLKASNSFESQPHSIVVEVNHYPSAFVDEDFVLTVKVGNQDERSMDVRLSIFLQTADEEDSKLLTLPVTLR